MKNLADFKREFGITETRADEARRRTQEYVEAYNLRQARKSCDLTQVQLADAMGVSQNRISRMENGDIDSMSIDTIRRYVEALGGSITVVADLPTGKVSLV